MTATAPVVRAEARELARLDAVRRFEVLDTPLDAGIDRVARLAARLLGTSAALVSIVDHDRVWFKSRHGVDLAETGRDRGLCASAVLQDATWVVEDARRDPDAAANPLVAGPLGLRFYAGAPLRTRDGHNLGVLCVLDRDPRSCSDAELSVLEDLAGIVVDELELRLAARGAAAGGSDAEALREERQRQALQLNDDVVQALAVAKMELQLGNDEAIAARIDHALESGKRILAELAADAQSLRRDERSAPTAQA